jgi:hypothetical protein
MSEVATRFAEVEALLQGDGPDIPPERSKAIKQHVMRVFVPGFSPDSPYGYAFMKPRSIKVARDQKEACRGWLDFSGQALRCYTTLQSPSDVKACIQSARDRTSALSTQEPRN